MKFYFKFIKNKHRVVYKLVICNSVLRLKLVSFNNYIFKATGMKRRVKCRFKNNRGFFWKNSLAPCYG